MWSHKETPKQAFAAREVHEALLELKQLLQEAANTTHAAELEAFHLAVRCDECHEVRLTLESITARLRSPDFDAKLLRAREKLEYAVSAVAGPGAGSV
jgi:hypothetical protein